MLTGKGRNEKGLIMAFYEHLLGDSDYAYKGTLATLTTPHKSGPDQEKANMHRRRWVRFSEPGNSQKMPPLQFSIMKDLTGDDQTNARGLHSTDTTTELWCTIALDMNRPPALDGDITDDAARERLIFIHFPYTFTPNEEKIAAQPKKYRRIDTSLKLQKEAYRCALFKYLFDSSLGVTTFDVEEGTEMPAPSMDIYQDEATKAQTKRFLQDADPLDNFLMSNYERDERDKTLHISIRDFTADFLKSDELQGCDDRAKYNTTSVFDMLQHNSNVAENDLFRPQNGMRRTIGGGSDRCKALLHWKKRATDDGSSSDESEQPSAPV